MKRSMLKQLKSFERGDYIRVTWFDASEANGPLRNHKKPECIVDEWGIFLGVEGDPKHLLLGKHYVHIDKVWAATRIPLSLIEKIVVVAKQSAPSVFLRKYVVTPPWEKTVKVKNIGT